MKVHTETVNEIMVITPEIKFIDTSNSHEFKAECQKDDRMESNVVFDFMYIDFIDSSGLGALLSCIRNIRGNDRDVVVCNLSQSVKNLFQLVRVHKMVQIHDGVAEALQAF